MGSKKFDGSATSATLRRRLSQIQACEKSGETLKAYAERHGLSVHSLYQAKKMARQRGLLAPHRSGRTKGRASKEDRAPRFVEARPPVALRHPVTVWRLRFRGGEVLESSALLDVELALRLVDALRDRP